MRLELTNGTSGVDKKATVIIAAKAGRLGNRLFQAAHFMGNALTTGYRLRNPSLGEYAPYFEGSSRDPMCGFPLPWTEMEPELAQQCRDVFYSGINLAGRIASFVNWPGVKAIDIRSRDEVDGGEYFLEGEAFHKLLETKGRILPMGWRFCDHGGMIRHREEIIAYFTPLPTIRQSAEAVIARGRERGDLVVGVHIRQEDYRRWKNGAYYFSTQLYAEWMRQIARGCEGKVSFVVCSSDPIDPRHMQDLAWIPAPGSPISDLHTLSLCDRIVGPPSTFSGWASYHGKVPICTLMSADQIIGAEHFKLPF